MRIRHELGPCRRASLTHNPTAPDGAVGLLVFARQYAQAVSGPPWHAADFFPVALILSS